MAPRRNETEQQGDDDWGQCAQNGLYRGDLSSNCIAGPACSFELRAVEMWVIEPKRSLGSAYVPKGTSSSQDAYQHAPIEMRDMVGLRL